MYNEYFTPFGTFYLSVFCVNVTMQCILGLPSLRAHTMLII